MTNPLPSLARKVVCPILAPHKVPLLKDVFWAAALLSKGFDSAYYFDLGVYQ